MRSSSRVLVPSRRQFLHLLGLAGMSAAAGVPPVRSQAPAASPLFEEVPVSASGLTWVHVNAISPNRYLPETMGPGVAFFDYDNDGWVDIFMVNSGATDFYQPAAPLKNALYKNNRDGTFTDVTDKAGVAGGKEFGMGCAIADYDNDGYPDILVTAYGRCTLYHNNGERHVHRRHRQGRRRCARLDDERRVVRLRQRRPARSVPLQLRRVLARPTTCSAATTSWASASTASRACSSRRPASSTTTTATAPSPRSARAPTSSARSARRSASSRPTSTATA